MSALIGERLDRGCDKGAIFDGFPRTKHQAEALEILLAERGRKLNYVIELVVDEEMLVERITGRFTCANCGEGYHDTFKPTKVPGVCDRCGSAQFVRRRDDNEEVVRSRLEAYHAQTKPLIGYYKARGKLRSVNGMAEIGAVREAIGRALDGIKSKSREAPG